MRHRVSIQEMVDAASDDYNQVLPRVPTTRTTVWAEITPLTGKQLEWGKKIHDQVTHRIRIRYWEDLTTDHRFLFGTRVFEILSILTTEEIGREQLCLCVEAV